MPLYEWLQFSAAQTALSARLADPNQLFWTQNEIILYIQEALQVWNCLVETWNMNFAFTATPSSVWYNFGLLANSPRLRTQTDTNIYTLMQYMLLEPPTGGTWTGTSQFSINDLSGALQRRRDEMIQAVGCNLMQLPALPSTPNTRRTIFTDSTLEPRRTRFIPDSSYGGPVTLTREDTYAFDHFEPSHLQAPGMPSAWSVITGPPLSMDVDVGPNVPGSYDVISLQAGPTFSPPASSLLGVPNDWAWVAKYGALADLLGRDSEATDKARADYSLKRFMAGLEVMKQSNWIIAATLNGIPCDLESMFEKDAFDPEWEGNASAWPALVSAGMDYVAACPVPTSGVVGVSAVVIGNAPLPVGPTDYVQIGRDQFDAILDYAMTLAMFKTGGQEFAQCKALEGNFYRLAVETNKRLGNLGFFRDELGFQGRRQDIEEPRDPNEEKKKRG
jgi:hypothetical protein